MKHFLSQLRTSLSPFARHKRRISWTLSILLAVFALYWMVEGNLLIESAFATNPQPNAANTNTTGTGNAVRQGLAGLGQGVGNVVANIATLFIKLLSGILWFVLHWMGDLMDNTFILEGEIGTKLRSVWVIVRNFVNIFFALALVIVALLSVVGYGDEGGNYAMKKFIPKMALALIAVNFTFLACRIVLDVNNVLTTAIFAIPQSVTNISDIGPSGTAGVRTFKKFSCLDNNLDIPGQQQRVRNLEAGYPGVINQLGGVCFALPYAGPNELFEKLPQSEKDKIANGNGQAIVPMSGTQFNKKDFVWIMATQFQGLHNLNKVSQLVDSSFSGLTVNALFSVLFAIIYGTAYVAMFIILLARVVVLWICIMLSPLAAISIAIPDFLPEELNIQKKFIDHAFVPAKMAIPLAFGYILISQMSLMVNTGSQIFQQKALDMTATNGEFARGISISSLMYGAASVAVIWMGVFTASKDVVGSELVGKLKDTVQNAGATVAKWPTYIPIVPVSGGLASIQNLRHGVQEMRNYMAEGQRTRDQQFFDRQLQRLGLPAQDARRAMQELQRLAGENNGARLTTAAVTSNLGKLTGEGNERHFASAIATLRRIDGNTPQGREAQARVVAGIPGVSNWQQFMDATNSSTNINALRVRMAGSTPNSRTPDGLDAITTPVAISGQLSSGARSGILDETLRSRYTETNGQLSVSGDAWRSLIRDMSDSSKFNSEAVRGLVTGTNLSSRINSNAALKAVLKGDGNTPFLRQLAGSLSRDPAHHAQNVQIRQLYADIIGESNVTSTNMPEAFRNPAIKYAASSGT